MKKEDLRYIGALAKSGIVSGTRFVPVLIAEVERLEADNARLEKEAEWLADHASKMERNAFPEDARSNAQWREIARKAVAKQEGKDANA